MKARIKSELPFSLSFCINTVGVGKIIIFVSLGFFGIRIWRRKGVVITILKSGQNYVNHKFHKKNLLFSDVREYLHGFDLVFTWLILFTGCADDIFHVISEFHARRSKCGGKFDKFGVKS